MKRFLQRSYLTLVLLFLYLPIAVLIVQSFNAGKSRAVWEGLSLRWYQALLQDQAIMKALYVTLTVAVIAAIAATVLGTLAAIGIHAMKKRPQGVMMTITNLPMTMPDIVTGISLMILFTFSKIERGYVTMLLAHITFNTPYVILSVLPKLKQMNKHTYEAALDLGATPTYSLFHVILPEISPGVVTGALLAFTLSLDDFVISYFTTSPMVQNLSTLIYSKARIGIEPTLNALSALMFLALLVLLLIVNRRSSKPADAATSI
ncbi:MAG: ABC transporter permease [Candidatus Limiplasma sp.]|nr:ABC transporter permease [Candidatus Limiplasma sp.]